MILMPIDYIWGAGFAIIIRQIWQLFSAEINSESDDGGSTWQWFSRVSNIHVRKGRRGTVHKIRISSPDYLFSPISAGIQTISNPLSDWRCISMSLKWKGSSLRL